MSTVKAAEKIKLVIFDVDGVFTANELFLSNDGNEVKAFHSHDGLGVKMLRKAGIETAVITARQSNLVEGRMKALGVEHIHQGITNKFNVYQQLRDALNLQDENIAMVGDDLPDLACIQSAGLGIAVDNADAFVKEHADWISSRAGGHAAVREICEMILSAQDKLSSAQQTFTLEAQQGE
jgi:3-deoxy-D-manno-octulosonate 8-phosphate phosphatase (KDO 8-P phosphatase)